MSGVVIQVPGGYGMMSFLPGREYFWLGMVLHPEGERPILCPPCLSVPSVYYCESKGD